MKWLLMMFVKSYTREFFQDGRYNHKKFETLVKEHLEQARKKKRDNDAEEEAKTRAAANSGRFSLSWF